MATHLQIVCEEARRFPDPPPDSDQNVDAARAAATVLANDLSLVPEVRSRFFSKQWEATQFAQIDPEGFYDFQATRPQVSLVDGITRRLDWPENAFFHAPIPGADRDIVLLLGVEPNLRWKTFTKLVLELAEDLGVEMLVTLGSLLADVPHTRPAPVE